MSARVEDYAYPYAILQMRETGLPDAFMREHEIVEKLEAKIADVLSEFNVHNYADTRQMAGAMFNDLLESGGLDIEQDEVAGDYFQIPLDAYKAYRRNVVSSNEVILRSRRIGARFFPEAFEAFESQLMNGSTTPQGALASIADTATAEIIPASDRLVTLSHNQPEYEEIQDRIDGAIQEVSTLQTNEISNDEKASVVAALKGASELWRAYQLTAVQVRVGVIMAIEEAQKITKKTFKLTGGTLLADAIKAFIKLTTGFDL